MIRIERAQKTDRDAIERLLAAGGLPLDGLELAMPAALVARDEVAIVGCAAVELHGPVGLLRSVCVARDVRGSGLGTRLVAAAETLAGELGATELYLLTETAVEWFPRLGYIPTTRSDVPLALKSSPEFAGACPDSAAVLTKRLQVS